MSILAMMGQKLVGRKDIASQARRYVETVLWLYHSVFRFRPGVSLVALGANMGGIMLHGAALTLLVYFARMLETNKPLTVDYFQYTLHPREPEGFAIMVVVIGLLLLVSGIVVFLANRTIIRLSVDFALDVSFSVLTLAAGRPSRNMDPAAGPYPKEIKTRALGVIVIARAVRPLMQLFRPFLLLILALAALIYIWPMLTLIVLLIVLPSFLFQYLINYEAAQNDKRMGAAQKKMQRGITGLLNGLAQAPNVAETEKKALALTYADDRIREYSNRYIERVMAQPKSQVVSDVLIAILAIMIIVSLGVSALQNQISWAMVLGYVVSARVVMSSLRGLLATITGFARHYPPVRRAYELMTSRPRPADLKIEKIRIRRSNPKSPGDIKAVVLTPGDKLALLSPVLLTRYNSYAWADVLTSGDKTVHQTLWAGMICISENNDGRPGCSLRELLAMDSQMPEQAVRTAAMNLVKRVVPDLTRVEVDTLLDEQTWKKIPEALRCHLLLEMGARNAKVVILVDQAVLAGAEKGYIRGWLKRIEDRLLIVRHNKASTIGHLGEKAVLAMRTDRKRSIMTPEWARLNFSTIHSWFKEAESAAGEDELDMMDDDMD